MEVGNKVICTKKLHGAYRKDQKGEITKIDDEVIWIDDICIAAHNFGKHFRVVSHFWMNPVGSRKLHLHAGDGKSLCGKFTVPDYSMPADDGLDLANDHDVCKTCAEKYMKGQS